MHVKGDVQARAQVSSIDTPVTVQDPISINGKVTEDGTVGAKVKPTLLPIPMK